MYYAHRFKKIIAKVLATNRQKTRSSFYNCAVIFFTSPKFSKHLKKLFYDEDHFWLLTSQLSIYYGLLTRLLDNSALQSDKIKHAGGFGKWQLKLLVILSFNQLFQAFHNIGSIFLSATPDHWCKLGHVPRDNKTAVKNLSLPIEIQNGVERIQKDSIAIQVAPNICNVAALFQMTLLLTVQECCQQCRNVANSAGMLPTVQECCQQCRNVANSAGMLPTVQECCQQCRNVANSAGMLPTVQQC
uniref:Uncharacterized protein n=1 Tax=Strigamia maritima TaxID=126957 RepID=T1JN75_STRMM